MRSERIFALAACGVAMLAGAASDPYDYKELVERRVEPVALVRNAKGHAVVDFGKDAFGWLEIAGGAGDYESGIGEMTNAEGRVTNPYPGQGLSLVDPVVLSGPMPTMLGTYITPGLPGDEVWSTFFDRLPHLGFRLCIGPKMER